jgi:hypothetical protein
MIGIFPPPSAKAYQVSDRLSDTLGHANSLHFFGALISFSAKRVAR